MLLFISFLSIVIIGVVIIIIVIVIIINVVAAGAFITTCKPVNLKLLMFQVQNLN